jgi:hypothetical protein
MDVWCCCRQTEVPQACRGVHFGPVRVHEDQPAQDCSRESLQEARLDPPPAEAAMQQQQQVARPGPGESGSSSRAWRESQVQDPARGPASRTRHSVSTDSSRDSEVDSESGSTAESAGDSEAARRRAAFDFTDPPRGTRRTLFGRAAGAAASASLARDERAWRRRIGRRQPEARVDE